MNKIISIKNKATFIEKIKSIWGIITNKSSVYNFEEQRNVQCYFKTNDMPEYKSLSINQNKTGFSVYIDEKEVAPYITLKVKKSFWLEIEEGPHWLYEDGYFGVIKSSNGHKIFRTKHYKHKSTCIQAIDNFCLETGLEIRG